MIGRLWRRYDVAISTQTGDRPTFLASMAGRFSVGLVPDEKSSWKSWSWKSWALSRSVVTDGRLHRVDDLFRLSAALSIVQRPDIVVPRRAQPQGPRHAYACAARHPDVSHQALDRCRLGRACRGRYANAGWRSLSPAGPDLGEKDYLDHVWNPVTPAVERLDGRLNWPELAQLMAGAAVYVGARHLDDASRRRRRLSDRRALRAGQPAHHGAPGRSGD
ncbi:MAG: hypothetical protein WDN48_17655 [Pseudolabrys sp.]